MKPAFLRSAVKFIALVPFFVVLGAAPASAASYACEDYLTTNSTSVGGVSLNQEQARLFKSGPRGTLHLLFQENFSADEKVALWQAASRRAGEKELFVSDEVHFEFEGQRVTAFVGLPSTYLRALLYIMEDGKVYLTHSTDYLDTLMRRDGGGVYAAIEGRQWKPEMASDMLKDFLASSLIYALVRAGDRSPEL